MFVSYHVLLDTPKDLALSTQGSFSGRFNEASQDSNCAKDKEIEELHQLTESHIDAKNKEINELRQQNKRLKDLLKKKNEQVKNRRHDFTWRSLNTDKKLKPFTGVPNKSAFNYLFKNIEKVIPKLTYWHRPSKQKVVSKKKIHQSSLIKVGQNRALSF